MFFAGITGISGLFDDPATLAAHSAAANVEDLHRRFELVVGEGNHVSVGAVAEHHRLLLHGSLQRGQVVTQPRGPLEIELFGRRVHLLLQLSGKPIGLAGQEVAEVFHDLAMLLGADPADTGRRAFVDVAEQTWTVDLPVPLEHSGRTGARREHPGEQIQRFPDGPRVRIRPEIAHTLAAWAAVDHQPGELFVEGDGQHRIGLVVAVADIEARIELLDPVVFQLQCLDFGVDHRPLDLGRGGHHLPGSRMQVGDIGEV